MLTGFAAVASGTGEGGASRQYVRPVLTEVGWDSCVSAHIMRTPSTGAVQNLGCIGSRLLDLMPSYHALTIQAGPIALVEARHPVLECLDSAPFQPNDTYLALSSSFHIITGGWHWSCRKHRCWQMRPASSMLGARDSMLFAGHVACRMHGCACPSYLQVPTWRARAHSEQGQQDCSRCWDVLPCQCCRSAHMPGRRARSCPQ